MLCSSLRLSQEVGNTMRRKSFNENKAKGKLEVRMLTNNKVGGYVFFAMYTFLDFTNFVDML
jgi:hypothetical protein